MSGFFSLIVTVALIALIVFALQARKKRPGASRKAWISLAVLLGASVLSSATMTPQQRADLAAQEQARVQAEARRAAATREAAAAESAERERERAEREAAQARLAIGESEFIVGCKQLVRRQLRLPDTARFAGFLESVDNDPVITETNARYSSWVEGENSFGGTVRNMFVCTYDKASDIIRVSFIE